MSDEHKLAGAPRSPKDGERECPYCYGYGYNPRGLSFSDPPSGSKAVRCEICNGKGTLASKKLWG